MMGKMFLVQQNGCWLLVACLMERKTLFSGESQKEYLALPFDLRNIIMISEAIQRDPFYADNNG